MSASSETDIDTDTDSGNGSVSGGGDTLLYPKVSKWKRLFCCFGRSDNSRFTVKPATASETAEFLLSEDDLFLDSLRNRIDDNYVEHGAAGAGALATGLLRITAEKHFMTDVLTGWAFGAMFGYVLPTFVDYGPKRNEVSANGFLSLHNVAPFVGPDARGLQYSFRF